MLTKYRCDAALRTHTSFTQHVEKHCAHPRGQLTFSMESYRARCCEHFGVEHSKICVPCR